MMKIKKGHSGGVYIVFRDEYEAERWKWLFGTLLNRRWACFNAFFNSFELIKP